MSNYEKFIDPRDNNEYRIVRLKDGNKWFADNFRCNIEGSLEADSEFSSYIAKEMGYSDWGLDKGIDYDSVKYGRLYDWETAKRAAPNGWKLPNIWEWRKLLSLYPSIYHLNKAEFSVMLGLFGHKGDITGSSHYLNQVKGTFWSSSEHEFLPSGLFKTDLAKQVVLDQEGVHIYKERKNYCLSVRYVSK